MLRPRQLASPFRYFNSAPEVIRLAVLLYVKYPRAVDHDGELLESFVTKERDKAAALKFMKKADSTRIQNASGATAVPKLTFDALRMLALLTFA